MEKEGFATAAKHHGQLLEEGVAKTVTIGTGQETNVPERLSAKGFEIETSVTALGGLRIDLRNECTRTTTLKQKRKPLAGQRSLGKTSRKRGPAIAQEKRGKERKDGDEGLSKMSEGDNAQNR